MECAQAPVELIRVMGDLLVIGQANLREPREQRLDGDTDDQECERTPDASAGAVAKSKMGSRVRTLNIKLVGMGKLARITVGRREQHQQPRSCRDTAGGKLDLLRCPVKEPLHRRLDPVRFMQGIGKQCRVHCDLVARVGVLEEQPHGISDEIDGGQGRVRAHPRDHLHQFSLADALLPVPGKRERRQHIITGLLHALFQCVRQVAKKPESAGSVSSQADEILGELHAGSKPSNRFKEELTPFLPLQAEEFAKDQEWKRERELFHAFNVSGCTEGSDKLIRQAPDGRFKIGSVLPASQGMVHEYLQRRMNRQSWSG